MSDRPRAAGRPRKPDKKVPLGVRVEPELRAQITAMATERGCTVSQVTIELLEWAIEHEDERAPPAGLPISEQLKGLVLVTHAVTGMLEIVHRLLKTALALRGQVDELVRGMAAANRARPGKAARGQSNGGGNEQ